MALVVAAGSITAAEIDWAGVEGDEPDYAVTIIQRLVPGRLDKVKRFSSLNALREFPDAVPELKADDQIIVGPKDPAQRR